MHIRETTAERLNINGHEVVINPSNLTAMLPLFGAAGVGRGIVTDGRLYVFHHQLYHAEVAKKMQFENTTYRLMFYYRKRTQELFVLPSTEEKKPVPADFFYDYPKGMNIHDIVIMRSYSELSKLMEEDRGAERGWMREAKQTGTLYHFTTPYHLQFIIKEGKLKDTTKSHVLGQDVISFTRNPNYTVRNSASVRLAFDGSRLSTRFKIKPHDDMHYSDEMEEAVYAKEIPLKPYLLQIDIDKDWENVLDDMHLDIDNYDHDESYSEFEMAVDAAHRKGYKINFVNSFRPVRESVDVSQMGKKVHQLQARPEEKPVRMGWVKPDGQVLVGKEGWEGHRDVLYDVWKAEGDPRLSYKDAKEKGWVAFVATGTDLFVRTKNYGSLTPQQQKSFEKMARESGIKIKEDGLGALRESLTEEFYKKPQDEFSKRLRTILYKNKTAYRLLRSIGTQNATWLAGGCAVLAFALSEVLNAPVYVCFAYDQPQHFVVKVGNHYIDGYGMHSESGLRKSMEEEMLHDFQLLPYDDFMEIPESTPYRADIVDALSDLIRKYLEPAHIKHTKYRAPKDFLATKRPDHIEHAWEDEEEDNLTEAKQVGLLYHFTHPSLLVKILQDGYLTSKWNQGVSLTRNPQLNHSGGSIRMVFDGNKISERHKVKPFMHPGVMPDKMPVYRKEAEETVDDPFFFKKYLLAVEFNPQMEIKDRSLEIETANEILERRYNGMSITTADDPNFSWPKHRITEVFKRPPRGREHQSGGHSYFYGRRGAGLVAVHAGSILLCLRSAAVNEPGTWSYPGGRIDDDAESAKAAAVREFKEETGYRGKFIDLQHLTTYKEEGFQYDTFIAYVPEKFMAVLNWENAKAKWFKIDELPARLHPGMKESLHAITAFVNKEPMNEEKEPELVRIPDPKDKEACLKRIRELIGPLTDIGDSKRIELDIEYDKTTTYVSLRYWRTDGPEPLRFAAGGQIVVVKGDKFYIDLNHLLFMYSHLLNRMEAQKTVTEAKRSDYVEVPAPMGIEHDRQWFDELKRVLGPIADIDTGSGVNARVFKNTSAYPPEPYEKQKYWITFYTHNTPTGHAILKTKTIGATKKYFAKMKELAAEFTKAVEYDRKWKAEKENEKPVRVFSSKLSEGLKYDTQIPHPYSEDFQAGVEQQILGPLADMMSDITIKSSADQRWLRIGLDLGTRFLPMASVRIGRRGKEYFVNKEELVDSYLMVVEKCKKP